MTITKWHNIERYRAQTDIVKQALSTPEHALDYLLASMRSTGQATIYFSGTRLDHDYCFGSEEVGVLLSVLPEDEQKAEVPGYHPGSTEVYVTFQGNLTVERMENGQVHATEAGQDRVLILPPGQCHRVRNRGEKAASLIVKTNLSYKPSVVRCDTCAYYPRPEVCALYQRWNAEKKS